MKRLVALCLSVLLLAGLAGCSLISIEDTRDAMKSSLADGKPQRAVDIGLDWLEKNSGDDSYGVTDLYLELAEICEEELEDPDRALEILKTGWESTGSGSLFDEYIGRALGEEALRAMADALPGDGELLAGDRPFSQWTEDDLWDYARRWKRDDSYESRDTDSWYVSASMPNGDHLRTSYYGSSYSETLSLEFAPNGSANTAPEDGPYLQPPRDILYGDKYGLVLEKLGVPEEILPYLEQGRYVSIDVDNWDVRIWLSAQESGDRGYQSLTVSRAGETGFVLSFNERSQLNRVEYTSSLR